MRSLSPSRTFTCTRTVSPAFICGRSVSCVFSTISIAPMGGSLLAFHQLSQDLLLFHIQLGSGQQLRTFAQRELQRAPLPPPPDFPVVPGYQDVGHFQIPELGR